MDYLLMMAIVMFLISIWESYMGQDEAPHEDLNDNKGDYPKESLQPVEEPGNEEYFEATGDTDDSDEFFDAVEESQAVPVSEEVSSENKPEISSLITEECPEPQVFMQLLADILEDTLTMIMIEEGPAAVLEALDAAVNMFCSHVDSILQTVLLPESEKPYFDNLVKYLEAVKNSVREVKETALVYTIPEGREQDVIYFMRGVCFSVLDVVILTYKGLFQSLEWNVESCPRLVTYIREVQDACQVWYEGSWGFCGYKPTTFFLMRLIETLSGFPKDEYDTPTADTDQKEHQNSECIKPQKVTTGPVKNIKKKSIWKRFQSLFSRKRIEQASAPRADVPESRGTAEMEGKKKKKYFRFSSASRKKQEKQVKASKQRSNPETKKKSKRFSCCGIC